LSHLKMSAFCMRQTGVANEPDRDDRAVVDAFGGALAGSERWLESGVDRD